MLKKLGIAGVIAATLTLGATGVAFAGDFSGDHKSHHKSDHDSDHDSDHKSHHGVDGHDVGINCSSYEELNQENYGDQLIGGNLSVKNITGFIGGVIDKPAVCPSVGNDNQMNFNFN
jgi:hypothetical protein